MGNVFIPPHRGGGPAGWRGYSAPLGRGPVADGGGGIPYSAPSPPLRGPPLRGRGITPPQFRPNRAPRNCKISWVIPGEGNPQGGGGILTLPVASRHPSAGGELYRHDENFGAVRRRNHRVFINNKACFRVHNYSTQMRRRNRIHCINTNRRYINP